VFIIAETCFSSRCRATAVSSGSTIPAFSHYVTISSRVGKMEYNVTYNCSGRLDFLSGITIGNGSVSLMRVLIEEAFMTLLLQQGPMDRNKK
jgi:hypothetical protein